MFGSVPCGSLPNLFGPEVPFQASAKHDATVLTPKAQNEIVSVVTKARETSPSLTVGSIAATKIRTSIELPSTSTTSIAAGIMTSGNSHSPDKPASCILRVEAPARGSASRMAISAPTGGTTTDVDASTTRENVNSGQNSLRFSRPLKQA